MDRGEPYDPLDIPDLIVAFSECFSPVLEQIQLTTEYEYCSNESMLSDHRFAFGFDVIAPFLQFNHLTKLDLDWVCTADVDDKAFNNMVQSWPQLEEFLFGSLVHLIHHCRHLHCIDMRFSACSIDIDSEPFSTTLPNHRITRLFVGFSPIVDPMAVACQLRALMPYLPSVTRHEWDSSHDDREVPFDEEWDRVDEYLQVLTKHRVVRRKIGAGL
ncbi:hypothetical protein AZE42_09624 [Rhizopogon vesiculosus]|uniref:F-box domain-containing protein n=1 Tax=Rhizopogon vesiculosus TaxID=180088 RepID=A0A1J8QD62_9AGAM|nr:hypothetical protein AZE42_09624 [Rhizopogon vesiculosus]